MFILLPPYNRIYKLNLVIGYSPLPCWLTQLSLPCLAAVYFLPAFLLLLRTSKSDERSGPWVLVYMSWVSCKPHYKENADNTRLCVWSYPVGSLIRITRTKTPNRNLKLWFNDIQFRRCSIEGFADCYVMQILCWILWFCTTFSCCSCLFRYLRQQNPWSCSK